jgi:hypothetical protein
VRIDEGGGWAVERVGVVCGMGGGREVMGRKLGLLWADGSGIHRRGTINSLVFAVTDSKETRSGSCPLSIQTSGSGRRSRRVQITTHDHVPELLHPR